MALRLTFIVSLLYKACLFKICRHVTDCQRSRDSCDICHNCGFSIIRIYPARTHRCLVASDCVSQVHVMEYHNIMILSMTLFLSFTTWWQQCWCADICVALTLVSCWPFCYCTWIHFSVNSYLLV